MARSIRSSAGLPAGGPKGVNIVRSSFLKTLKDCCSWTVAQLEVEGCLYKTAMFFLNNMFFVTHPEMNNLPWCNDELSDPRHQLSPVPSLKGPKTLGVHRHRRAPGGVCGLSEYVK